MRGALGLGFLLVAACGSAEPAVPDAGPVDGSNIDDAGPVDAANADAAVDDLAVSIRLVDDRTAYLEDSLELLQIRITTTDLVDLERVQNNEPGASVAVHFSEGTFGPGTAPNAILELRGATTRDTEQKSYKLKLDSATELWRGQRVINLNKHPYDLTRARNKLAFDLFEEVEDFTSLRTQFVAVTINGTAMGLYTQIDQPNRLFLERHGLDPNGWLYKANNFTFFPIPDAVAADPLALDAIVEAKGVTDHSKLQAMLLALDDSAIDIDAIIDRNNYETWLAVNLLLGNWDTISQNFYLYSPTGSERWYFLPWDYDGAFGYDEQPGNPQRPPTLSGRQSNRDPVTRKECIAG